jgi:ParB-like chromosome segregation protein Spo0J
MKITVLNISELVTPEKNIRIHTDKQIKEFVRSINMFGQIRPAVVDENNVILAGNGLVEALKAAGKTEVEVYKIENLTENQKKKLMIADNKIFGLGIENLDTLNSFLEELGSDLDIPGFDEEILKTMVADAETVTDKLSEYGTLDQKEIEEIKANKERKETRIEQSGNSPEEQEPDPQENKSDDTTNEGKTKVVCPKCGEIIWL